MKDFSGLWEGNIEGTNRGRLVVKINQQDEKITGTANISDNEYGMYNYLFNGRINLDKISMDLIPEYPSESLGNTKISGQLTTDGFIKGEWNTTVGTFGTFYLSQPSKENTNTSISDKKIIEKNSAFIMMAIKKDDPQLVDVLDCVKRVLNDYKINTIRVDEIEHSNRITDLILHSIKENRYLICDLSYERPNVYYELGFAHGFGREVILIAKEGTKLHFDIKDYNVIYYKNMRELEERIKKRINATIQSNLTKNTI